jgi:hypothetical protein
MVKIVGLLFVGMYVDTDIEVITGNKAFFSWMSL